jgi:hypothetical protein
MEAYCALCEVQTDTLCVIKIYRLTKFPLPVHRFSPISIIRPLLYTHCHLNIIRTGGRRPETFELSNALSDNGGLWIKMYFDTVY